MPLERNIIGIRRQQDHVAVVPEIQRFDDPLIKQLPHVLIPQMRLSESLQKPMLIAVLHLLRRKFDVQQVLAQRTRNGLFQKLQIQLCLFLFHQPH